MTAPSYRFNFEIVDETTGTVVISDFCGLTGIDQLGGCESVDMHVASMLRAFTRKARGEYERAEYPDMADKQLATPTTERIRQAGRETLRTTLADISKSGLLR